jgi:hypothetical protein
MQIDFHQSATYCIARLAGFSHQEAEVVAHCAQYVDDATHAGLIHFDNGALFQRTSSAHKKLDYRNFEALANHLVWIPFHFLPGNGGLPAGQDPEGKFIHKLICRPNSPVAQEIVRECIQHQPQPYALHRLGIVMHVYADTWAHQGFAGVNHQVNQVSDLVDDQGNPDREHRDRVEKYFQKNILEQIASWFVSEALPLGHGAVLSHPDKLYLRWGYTNGLGETIKRDNPTDFLCAADHLCQWMQRYRLGDPDAEVPGLPTQDKELMDRMFRTITNSDGKERHHQWLATIRAGQFSFGSVDLVYIPKGRGSWKHQALDTESEV